MQRPDGRLELVVTVRGISPGRHGVHVHTTGACQPTFAAAGGHWNPGATQHGLDGTDGQHAGDMPNVEVGANGSGSLTYGLAPSATLAGLLDADGSAFVVHAGEDDQRTDPAGNSGDRLACGVFVGR
jgi:Cu-Zn family superoxide dismutase